LVCEYLQHLIEISANGKTTWEHPVELRQGAALHVDLP
jgi:hypothetical protein